MVGKHEEEIFSEVLNLILSFHFVFPKLVKKVKKNKNFVSKNRNLKKVKK
jgi:hypothetical protein